MEFWFVIECILAAIFFILWYASTNKALSKSQKNIYNAGMGGISTLVLMIAYYRMGQRSKSS